MNYYNEIKDEILDIEANKQVKDYSKNKRELEGYYKIGKLLIEAQGGETRAKYGNSLIKEYSKKLTNEIGKTYTYTSLSRMRQFYIIFKNVAPMAQQLSWSHYQELLPIKDENKRNYYINECIKKHLSRAKLRNIIKSNEYERLDEETKIKLIKNQETNIQDFIKHPIIIKNNNYDKISEKILKQLILEDLDNFLLELGEGFTCIKNEYKIKVGNTYNYIDILLFNIKYNCYTIVELKVTELKKEHIGQIQVYMNYIDNEIKTINHDKTIGIIICREGNDYIMKYCSDTRIYQTTYLTVSESAIEYV